MTGVDTPEEIRVGDYVIPDDPETPDSIWTPCRVMDIHKNGNLRARDDAKTLFWRGPVGNFKKVEDPRV